MTTREDKLLDKSQFIKLYLYYITRAYKSKVKKWCKNQKFPFQKIFKNF